MPAPRIRPHIPTQLLLWPLVLSLLLPASTTAATPAEAEGEALTSTSLIEALERVDRSLRRAIWEGEGELDPDLISHGELQALMVKAAHDPELQAKFRVLSHLRRAVEGRQRNSGSGSAWHQPLERRRTHLDATRHKTCADALLIAEATTATATLTSDRPEVWFRYRAAHDGLAIVTTVGSAMDTTIDVYSSCPRSTREPTARFDDEVGLEARATLRTRRGGEQWIRVSGWRGATGLATVTLSGSSSGIAGRVTEEGSGVGLANWGVIVFDGSDNYVQTAFTNTNGDFLAAVPPGTYYATAEQHFWPTGLLAELYDDIPCMGGALSGCMPSAGSPIVVPVEGVLSGVDFALGRGGTISGRVRDAQTGSLLSGVEVVASNNSGSWVASSATDAAGRFSLTGLGGLVYIVARTFTTLHQAQLYDGLPCPTGYCDPTAGTPLLVDPDQVITGVDFALERYGAIAGTVTRTLDGSPVPNLTVMLFDENNQVGSGTTNHDGTYRLGAVPAGTYFLRTWSGEFLDELYGGLECPTSCQPTDGTPVVVTNGSTVAGIDFSLARLGSIAGHVAESGSNVPIPWFGLALYDDLGNVLSSTFGFGGTFEVAGLAPGTYYLSASSAEHAAEVYDNTACPQGQCDGDSGTPLVLSLDSELEGIDFTLERLGTIAGLVLDSATNEPAAGVLISAWGADGQWAGYANTEASGTYEVQGLYPGSYFVSATDPRFLGRLFDGLPCPPGCDPTTGHPVPVAFNATTGSVDFSLTQLGQFSGVVRSEGDEAAIPWANVTVYDQSGSQVRSINAGALGTYEVRGLAAGTYFAVAYSFGHSLELFDDLPCPPGACHRTLGTPIQVSDGVAINGVDFTLPAGASLRGRVTSLGTSLPDRYVDIRGSSGATWTSEYTDSDGWFEAFVPAGTWFLTVQGTPNHFSQIYDGVSCSWPCDVQAGAPVVALPGTMADNLNFDLEPARGLVGRVSDHSANPLPAVAIDLWSDSGSHVGTGVSGPDGYFHVAAPSAGTFRVSTDNGIGALDELWDDIPCPLGPAYLGLCDPTAGQAVVLPTSETLITGIDFVLSLVPIFGDGFESGNTAAWSTTGP